MFVRIGGCALTGPAPNVESLAPRSNEMEFSIQLGTSRRKVARMLVLAAGMLLGGLVLGAADVGGYVPGGGWIPAIAGLLLAATALYRLLARPVVITIDQAGLRIPRQIQLLPWNRIAELRGFSRHGLTPFIIVRTIEPKTIPGFAAGRGTSGLAAPKVADDEIALNLTGVGARVDELVKAIEHIRARRGGLAEEQDQAAEPVDPLDAPVVQRIVDSNAATAGPLRWLVTIFGPVFGIFALWALLAMTSSANVDIALIVAGAASGIWLIGSLIAMIIRTTSDRCPKCKQAVRYFKAHAGRPLTCPPCRHVWPAGKFNIR